MYCITRNLRLLTAAILAMPLPLVVYADERASGPAVSGFNTKFSAEAGVYDDEGAGLLQGSVTTPLGQSFGLQLDGTFGSIDNETLTGGAVHLFTRDPSRYLFGVYASGHSWDSIDITRLAVEGEFYMGRVTFSGIAGLESISFPGTKRARTVTNRGDDHGFTELDLSYYPKDNLRLSVGYHYENEINLGVAELEYVPKWQGMPMSVFATGNFGEEEGTRVTGGVRFYFGADRNKSLIRRHREDDPKTYNPIFPQIATAAPNYCPVNVFLNNSNTCTCAPGSVFTAAKGNLFRCL